MTTAEREEFNALKKRVSELETLQALLIALGEHVGVDLAPAVPEPMAELVPFPAGPRKRAAGGVPRVTSVGAPCRVSTLGSAS